MAIEIPGEPKANGQAVAEPALVLLLAPDGEAYSWQFIQGGTTLKKYTLAAAAMELHAMVGMTLCQRPEPAVQMAQADVLQRMKRRMG